ncbi:hypothetical protein RB623_14660 [Mesorhizobium sp. LHD-90]|uniref:hypothetical protein n=1 Tax=Mesorhizobium sp. LHD-90 TaxID=3071414 RepID=UPI0027DEFD32|nr:hypothetical protein [Mesorhizobium sp. LHD-90]MDQ6435297.1 hypothetical protein [Mesorhizobium sp. LHD-90]
MGATAAIDKNWQALKRLLAMLVGMAELGFGLGLGAGGQTAGGQFTLFPQKDAAAQNEAQAEKSKLSPALTSALTLPRHLYRAILKLLRPAESTARRLIIAAARGLVVTLPPLRPRKPKEAAIRRGPRAFMPVGPKKRTWSTPRSINLPLLDPLRMPRPWSHPIRPKTKSVPRISGLDFGAQLRPLPAPPSPDDPVNASRLALRLEALGRALDDLPGQARRFARWKARRDDAAQARQARARAMGAQDQQGREAWRPRRVSPLRRGRPPGGRLSRYDPTATHPRNIREIDEILAHAHALAVYALENPDTS